MTLLNSLSRAITGDVETNMPIPVSDIQAPNDKLVQDYVLGFIDLYNNSMEPSRVSGTNGYSHVTSIIGLHCERQSVLARTHDVQWEDRVTGAHRIMWAQGRATENHIREAVIATADVHMVYGMWKCKCGHAYHLGVRPEGFVCQKCDTALDVYHEPLLQDQTRMITGSPDLTLLPRGHKLVVEIKSIAPDAFDELTGAMPDHAHQAGSYRRMYQEQGHSVTDEVVVIYGRKQFRWGGTRGASAVYKEYHIDATSDSMIDAVDLIMETGHSIHQHTATGTLPDRSVCISAADKKAQKCPVSHLCFGM